ncbi:MAG: glutamate--tRNA ligase [Proteobacteria bacterium]|nr:glutamate--tRNA ligase [Pseudomonadota bacterium]NCA28549.1 glutamate--tRNA ligase [Pseudomonadota bacterium]
MSVIVRFAPSPTGYLHIGGARTALFNFLFAKHNNGKFLLRIEDTDKDRSSPEAITAIIEGLNWLGLKHDENYVLQSNNVERHISIARQLLENDRAYLCYTSSEELEEMRQFAEKKGEVFRFKSPWRNKTLSQSSTIKPVIRIKAPQDGSTIIDDLVQGKIEVKNSELDDLVLLRNDSTPTYMLAVVVDDHDMNISHVIRGDDHLTNAFRQKIIYEAMSWNIPQFAHIPLIHGQDGAKMSKRHGATSVIEYMKMGYLPEAMRNYLLRLGWSHGNDEIISDQQAIEFFDIKNIGKSPSRFDFAKLNFLNKNYIKNKSSEELVVLIKNQQLLTFSDNEKSKLLKVIGFSKEKVELLTQLADICRVYQENFRHEINSTDSKIIVEKIEILRNLKIIFEEIVDWNHDNIKNSLDNFCKQHNLKIKDFGPVLRIALTFSSASAGGIFDVVDLLGKTEVITRINLVI